MVTLLSFSVTILLHSLATLIQSPAPVHKGRSSNVLEGKEPREKKEEEKNRKEKQRGGKREIENR